jgi:hypothetical protein
MKTLTSLSKEKSKVKAQLQGGECSLLPAAMRVVAIKQRELAFTLTRGSRCFQIAQCQTLGGGFSDPDRQSALGDPRSWRPEFCFANGRYARLALGTPVNPGLSPLLHPKPRPLFDTKWTKKFPNRIIRILKLLSLLLSRAF